MGHQRPERMHSNGGSPPASRISPHFLPQFFVALHAGISIMAFSSAQVSALTDSQIREAVGILDTDSVVFIKQYGERRTGTNALRALIGANFRNVFVLMHILGDKHDVPVDLERLDAALAGAPDPAWELVREATYARPGQTSYPGDYGQLRFLKALCASVYAAFHERRLCYALSVRNPYRWMSALLRHLGWPSTLDESALCREDVTAIATHACRAANDKHRAWLAFRDRARSPFVIVRAECLATRPGDVLGSIQAATGLSSVPGGFQHIPRRVQGSNWDYVRSAPSDAWFDLTPPVRHTTLPDFLTEVVARTIDWHMAAELGYLRDHAG
jgi:hypothetical protein